MKKSTVLKAILIGFALFLIFGTLWWGESEHWPSFLEGANNEKTYKSGPIAGTVILVTMYLAAQTMGNLKGKTNRWVAHNRAFLVNRNDGVFRSNDGHWIGRLVGGINVPGIGLSLRGSEGTLLLPHRSVREFGDNAIALCDVKRVRYARLPPELRELVDDENLPSPYWVGFKSIHVETRGKDWTADIREWKLQNQNEFTRERSNHVALQSAQAAARIANRQVKRLEKPITPKGFWDRLVTDDEEDKKDERDDP